MNKLKKTQSIIGLSVLAALAGFSGKVFAGGFQLYEENVANMGNAYAGMGAQAADASTEWYNPAGMITFCNPQFVLSGTYINVDAKVNAYNATNFTTDNIFLNGVPSPIIFPSIQQVNGSTNLTPGKGALVPAFHFVYPFAGRFAFGFGVNAPFGLETIYPNDSIVRFIATKSQVQDVDIGPSLAFAFNQHFSVGAGLDAQYLSATFDQEIADPLAAVPAGLGTFTNTGTDWGWGWHAGALYQTSPQTRFGLAYHSTVNHTIQGRGVANLTAGPTTGSFAGNLSASVTLPDYVDLSAYHDFDSQWAVLGSLDYTRWSTIQTLTANYTGVITNLVKTAQIPFDFKDTYRVSGGVNYKPTEKWTLRTGIAWDESPVSSDTTRTFRLPDSDRFWLGVGAQYIINRQFTLDAGYAHLFTQSNGINSTTQLNGTAPVAATPVTPMGTLLFSTISNGIANEDASVNEVGLQLTWNII